MEHVIRRLKRGDIKALEQIVTRYQTEAVRTAYLIVRDEQQARDIAQAAFLRAYERIEQFDMSYRFEPWFFRIVTNMAVKAVQGVERLAPYEEELDYPDEDAPQPEMLVSARELQAMVWAAMVELPPDQREVIVLRYFHDFTETEIARETDSPLGTVRWRIHAARKKLRGLLADADADVGASAESDRREVLS